MRILISTNGVPYLPNEGDAPPLPAPEARSFLLTVILFIALYAALHGCWSWIRDTAFERILIEIFMIKPTLALISLMTPKLAIVTEDLSIRGPGGGIAIETACTGMEMYFLLLAAFMVFEFRWKARVTGMALGCLLVFGLNEARILLLFYVYQTDQNWFILLHGIIVPIALIALTSLFFFWWVARDTANSATKERYAPASAI